jgi:glycosyltransferase involved in cell wall biosynthesis
MKLSVIIPVFHVERTLNRCVESVLAQDVEDMEVILVEDGSKDNCPLMCDEWANKDTRIRVIHKENGGLSDARNAGLDIAQGELITFVDSDDWIAKDTYEQLINMMDGCDMLEYSFTDRLQLKDRCYEDAGEYWLKEQTYTHTYAWNKIYRKTLFDSVRFPKGHIFEDVYTLPLLLRKAQKVKTTQRGYYHYEWNPTGITATADGQGLAQLLEAHLQSGMPIDERYYMYLVNIQIDVYEQAKIPISLSERIVNISEIPKRFRIKGIILNTCGIKTLCRIFRIIHLFKSPSRL